MKFTKDNLPQGYYIYAYVRSKDSLIAQAGTPYYIGKGKGKRAWKHHATIKVPRNINQIIILEANLTELGALALERRLIQWWGRKDLGSGILGNLTDGGEGSAGLLRTKEHTAKIVKANTGRKFSEKARKNMSESHMGKKLGPRSPEVKAKISRANKGRKLGPRGPMSEETKTKLSNALIGKSKPPASKETCTKRSLARKGCKHTDDAKSKISNALKGRILKPLAAETKLKISTALTGITRSDETRAKISHANKGKKKPPISKETKAKLSIAMKKVRAEKKLKETMNKS